MKDTQPNPSQPSPAHPAPAQPARPGYFGAYGGQFVPETLTAPLDEVEREFEKARVDPAFWAELNGLLADYVGRPSPVYHARRLSALLGGAQVWFKREDLNHTGAHKVNNVLAQALLARRMGKTRLIAETGAGMHGVATATAAALFGMRCDVFMGAKDMARQAPNVFRMNMMGAQVHGVSSGSATLKDAMNEALRNWVATVDDTFYVIGTVAGPHPYPLLVREFQRIIGKEAREQMRAKTGRLPDLLVACVGGGSNALGLFYDFLEDASVAMHGVEASGHGMHTGQHAAAIAGGMVGVLHGQKSYLLQTPAGQVVEAHSIAAGLDYPGVGPEHAHLADTGRVKYVTVTDDEAVEACFTLSRLEGILPAIESSHAIADAMRVAPTLGPDKIILVNLSGRGDKDLHTLINARPAQFDKSLGK